MGRWERIRRRPWLWASLAAMLALALITAATLFVNRDEGGTAGPVPTTTTPTTTPTTTTPTPATTTPVPTPSRPSPTEPKPSIAVPGVVSASAQEGAGSGEVEILWRAVPRATGYRIYRTNPAGGQLRLVVDFDITTGRVSAASEVLALSSTSHYYVPDAGRLTTPDRSKTFQYVDVGPSVRYYRVRAYNTAGRGPLSPVTYAWPPGADPPKPETGVPGVLIPVAQAGAGTGEVQIIWNAVKLATGYRVYRTDASGEQLRLVADFNVITGRVTATTEVTRIFSPAHSYVPGGSRLTTPDTSTHFQYVDVGSADLRHYRVRAYNANGAGPLSTVLNARPSH